MPSSDFLPWYSPASAPEAPPSSQTQVPSSETGNAIVHGAPSSHVSYRVSQHTRPYSDLLSSTQSHRSTPLEMTVSSEMMIMSLGTLYVGDLHDAIDEATLFEAFGSAGTTSLANRCYTPMLTIIMWMPQETPWGSRMATSHRKQVSKH